MTNRTADRAWAMTAVEAVRADSNRSTDTHLHAVRLPAAWNIDLYLKDESVHPTGSLKHRLARSLFLFGLVNGSIGPRTTVVEASSGSTAVSEAYCAQLLGLPLVAVMPRSTSTEKIALINRYGGTCHLIDDAAQLSAIAQSIADETGGIYLDQFTNAAAVTDWRGNNNIACSIFDQLARERHPVPAWIVVGAGTGGTSATIGRYCRFLGLETRLAVVDPEGSVYRQAWLTGRRDIPGPGSRIEGIGRPRVEPSFVPAVIDEMVTVEDATSIALAR